MYTTVNSLSLYSLQFYLHLCKDYQLICPTMWKVDLLGVDLVARKFISWSRFMRVDRVIPTHFITWKWEYYFTIGLFVGMY